MSKGLIKIILKRTLPVLTGYLFLGIGFGVLLNNAGYGIGWAFVMSLTIFSGTLQYVGVSVLASGASIISTIILSFLVNARYMFYAISNIDRFKGTGKLKPYLIHGQTDETYAIICTSKVPKGVEPKLYYFLVSIFDHIYWIVGSCIGAALGSAFKFNTTGIDFIMTALFVTIFIDQWRDQKNHIPAITGVLVSVICLLIFGAENFLIPSMIAITIVLSVCKGRIEKK